MAAEFIKDGSTLTVIPNGRIDSLTSSDLEEKIRVNITDEITNLRVDMSNVSYISSKGVRILLILHRHMLPRGGMVLFNLNNSVKEVLRLSALLKTFNIE